MNTILNIPALIKDIYEDSRKMYKVIGELDDIYRAYEEYPNTDQFELEEYLVSYIESMHTKICIILEFYNLNQLYEQYLKEYNSYPKSKLKHYVEVDVLDSPVFGIMNKYIRAISFIENISIDNSIHLQNNNNIVNDNKTKVDIAVNNKMALENIFKDLNNIEFIKEEQKELLQSLIKGLEELKETNTVEDGLVKNQLKKIKDFFITTGEDYVKDEFKAQIPMIIGKLSELVSL